MKDAFPAEVYGHGMTLRDYIAIHATDADLAWWVNSSNNTPRATARYLFADAMLSERNKS